MKAIVTGGAGFIGSHLVESLVNKNCSVIVLDNFSTGTFDNIKHLQNTIEIVHGDIRDNLLLEEIMPEVDYVFHLAALTSVTQSVAEPLLTYDINVNGTLNLLWHAYQYNIKRVIMASSCAIYGDHGNKPIDEFTLPNPLSPYASSKLILETYGEAFYKNYGLETISLRFFNVYGPRQNPNSEYAAVIPKFIDKYTSKKSPVIFGDGLQSRDFIHVTDLTKALCKAAFDYHQVSDYRIFNLATGRSKNLLEILDIISESFEYHLEPLFELARMGDIKHSHANVSLSHNVLGFQTSFTPETGIKNLIQESLQHNAS